MYSCLRQTFSFHKKFLISYNSYHVQYFSALTSMRDKISSNHFYEHRAFLKINKPNFVINRGFSLVNVNDFYDSIKSSEASKLLKEALIGTHDFTGFSWTVIIIATSAVLKLLIAFPCSVYQRFLTSKLELIGIELAGKRKNLLEKIQERATKERWTEKKMKYEFMVEVVKERKRLIIANNCHPFKAVILFFFQIPFWLLISVTLRKFAEDVLNGKSGYPVAALQFQVGGPFWCPNLTLPDNLYIIPAINFLALLTCIELSLVSKIHEKVMGNKSVLLIKKILPNISRLTAVLFFFISSVAPSGLSLFWMSCTVIALAENLLLMSPKVRRFLKIPKTPSEYDRPFDEAKKKFLDKFRSLFFRKK